MLLFLIFFALIFGFTPYCSIFASPTELQSKETSKLIGVKSPELEATKLGSHVRSCRPRDVEVFSTHNCLFPDRIETIHESQVRSNPSDHYENRTIHYGDIVVKDDESLLIKECVYIVLKWNKYIQDYEIGSIILKDDAKLIVHNATLISHIALWNRAIVSIVNSTLEGRMYDQGYTYSTVSIVNSTIGGEMFFQGESSVHIINSRVAEYKSIEIWAHASVTIENSTISYTTYLYDYASLSIIGSRSLYYTISYDDSTVSIDNSIINWVEAHDSSIVLVSNSIVGIHFSFEGWKVTYNLTDLHSGQVEYWNVHVNTTLNVDWDLTVTNSEVSWWVSTYQSSIVSIQNSKIRVIRSWYTSSVTITNSVVQYIECGGPSSSVSVINSTIKGYLTCEGGTASIEKSTASIRLLFDGTSSATLTLQPGYFSYWSNWGITIRDSEIREWQVYCIESASVSIVNSTITRLGYDINTDRNVTIINGVPQEDFAANVTVSNSTIHHRVLHEVNTYGNSTVSIINSTVERIGAYDHSVVYITNSVLGFSYTYRIEGGWIHARDLSSITITSSTVSTPWCSASSNAYVHIYNSTIERFSSTGSAQGWIINSRVNVIKVSRDSMVYIGWYLTVTVTSNNRSLEGARVEVYSSDGELVASGATVSGGKAHFALPEKVIQFPYGEEYIGDYKVRVIYHGLLAEQCISLDRNKQVTLSPTAIASIKAHFVDGDGDNLTGLVVRLFNSSGSLIRVETADLTGWSNFTNLLLGVYVIKPFWKGIQVANYTVKVTSQNPRVIIDPISCGVYDYYVHVLDGDMEAVSGSNVTLSFTNGSYYASALTNASGCAEFINLPNTTYRIRTFYQGTLVSDLTDTLSSEAQTKIVNAAIYDLFIQCVDGDKAVVSDVIVHLYNSSSLIKTVTTDAYGYAEFTQLPNTTYTFNVTYFGVKVGEGSLTLSSEDQMETVSLWIYDWNIKLLDGDGEALPNTKVEVYLWDGSLWGELRTTDKGFIRLLNFPSESYTFKAYWKGVKVLDVTFPLTSEEQTNNIQCAVFDLVVRVVDEEGNGLPNADVTLFWMNGTAITTTSTNSTGHTVFENMPGTTYSIKVTLKKYKDAREDITLTSEDQLTIITVQPLSKPFTSTPTGIATIAGVAIAGITVVMIVLIKKGIICK